MTDEAVLIKRVLLENITGGILCSMNAWRERETSLCKQLSKGAEATELRSSTALRIAYTSSNVQSKQAYISYEPDLNPD